MPKVYIAAAFRRFSNRDESGKAYGEIGNNDYVDFLEQIEEIFLNFGFDTCLPHRDEGLWGKVYYEPTAISALCFRHVHTSDVVFAIVEGGRGVHIELGFAMGLNKKLIMMHCNSEEPSTLIYGIPTNLSPWKTGIEDSDAVIITYSSSSELLERLERCLSENYRRDKRAATTARSTKAIIDIGSHTIKLKVFSFRKGSHKKVLLESKNSLGIMGDVLKNQAFSGSTVSNVVSLLKSWKQECSKLKCDSIIVTGTAALRKASNAEDLLSEVKTQTDLDIQILTPQKELEYVFSGVLATFRDESRKAVLNLGGGSTQIGIGCCSTPTDKIFLDFGTRRLTERWPWDSPMKDEDYEALLNDVRREVNRAAASVSEPVKRLVHTGGELDFMLRCELPLQVSPYSPVHVSEIPIDQFSSFSRQFSRCDPQQIASQFRLDPAWASGAVASNVIALSAAEALGAEAIIPSNCNISDGLLLAS